MGEPITAAMSQLEIDSTLDKPSPLLQLPRELILQILGNLSTLELLPYSSVCRQLYSLVVRSVYGRLVAMTQERIAKHDILFRCFHPGEEKPPVRAVYHDSFGLDAFDGTITTFGLHTLGLMRAAHTTFVPLRHESPRTIFFDPVDPAGKTGLFWTPEDQRSPCEGEAVIQELRIEAGEMFSQVQTRVSLVDPLGAASTRQVYVRAEKDRTVRVYREWLVDQCLYTQELEREAPPDVDKIANSILFTDDKHDIGFKVRARLSQGAPHPVEARDTLMCEVTFTGVVFRSFNLLMAMESTTKLREQLGNKSNHSFLVPVSVRVTVL